MGAWWCVCMCVCVWRGGGSAEVCDRTLWQMLDLVTTTATTAQAPPPFTHTHPHTPTHTRTPVLLFFWIETEKFTKTGGLRHKEQREAWLPDLSTNPPTFPFQWLQARLAGGKPASLPACLPTLSFSGPRRSGPTLSSITVLSERTKREKG